MVSELYAVLNFANATEYAKPDTNPKTQHPGSGGEWSSGIRNVESGFGDLFWIWFRYLQMEWSGLLIHSHVLIMLALISTARTAQFFLCDVVPDVRHEPLKRLA